MVTAGVTRSFGRRDFIDIRRDTLKKAVDILEHRFSPDQDMIEIIQPFILYDSNANIRQIHKMFGADLQLSNLNLEFNEIMNLKLCNGLSITEQMKKLIEPINRTKYDSVHAIISRVAACTPQSADTERLIKAANLVKTAFRTSLNLDTENKYMYVYFNMPPLETWNPRGAITIWLNDKNRREHKDLLQKDTAKKKPYFKGIFQSVTESDDDDDDDEDNSMRAVDKNIKF